MGVESARLHGILNDESLWNVFCCLLCIFYCQTTPILKTLGQFEKLVFVVMPTRENIRLIARSSCYLSKMGLFSFFLYTFTINCVTTGARKMPIEYMFCFIYSEQCIKIISSPKKVVFLFLYSRKLFLITLPSLLKKLVG